MGSIVRLDSSVKPVRVHPPVVDGFREPTVAWSEIEVVLVIVRVKASGNVRRPPPLDKRRGDHRTVESV